MGLKFSQFLTWGSSTHSRILVEALLRNSEMKETCSVLITRTKLIWQKVESLFFVCIR